MIVRELLTYLGFDLNETGFKRAEKGFQSLIGLSIELVDRVVGIRDRLFHFAEAAAQAGSEARKTGMKLGLTTEEVQELAYAQDRTTQMSDALSNGLFQLTRRAEEARHGNKAMAEGFNRLGISVFDVATGKVKPTALLLGEVSDKIKGLKSQSERNAAGFRVMGRGVAALMPFLTKGSKEIANLREEAHTFAYVISTEEAEAGHEFELSLHRLGTVIDYARRKLGVGLIPLFHRITENTLAWLMANRALIDRGIWVVITAAHIFYDTLMKLKEVIQNNSRFLIILAGVIGFLLLPAILSATFALLEMFLTLAVEAAIAAAPILLIVAALLLVAGAIEEVYLYLTGGQTLIGEFFKAFLDQPEDPRNHWIVKVLQEFLIAVRSAINFWKTFVDGFTEGVAKSGLVDELKKAIDTAIVYWKGQIKAAVKGIFGGAPAAEYNPGGFRASHEPTTGPRAAFRALLNPLFGEVPSAYAQPGSSPLLSSQGGTNISIEGSEYNVEVNAGGGAQSIADETMSAIEEFDEKRRREVSRQLAPVIVR